MFEQTSAVGVETVLNRLPQFVPAVTQFTTGDVQQTATNTVGASTVSLRGLGPNRNLVLINGRRAMPVDRAGRQAFHSRFRQKYRRRKDLA
ncbi:MAG: TonB-dependent receptor plug domain-containing protein [Nitrospira sp.]|nr:TonB-dependent receptor plug domain-containing protein [Nitrospira sp.]